MRDSFAEVMNMFRVVPGQPGFLSKARRLAKPAIKRPEDHSRTMLNNNGHLAQINSPLRPKSRAFGARKDRKPNTYVIRASSK